MVLEKYHMDVIGMKKYGRIALHLAHPGSSETVVEITPSRVTGYFDDLNRFVPTAIEGKNGNPDNDIFRLMDDDGTHITSITADGHVVWEADEATIRKLMAEQMAPDYITFK